MSPFHLLEVAPGADEREIKRAYARLLKRTRPDDDAAAFQRLQDAYAHCLDIARRRAVAWNDGEDEGDGTGAVETVPTPHGGATCAGPTAQADGDSFSPAPADADAEAVAAPEPQQYFDVAAFVASLHELLEQPSPARMHEWLYAQEPLYSVQLKQALRPAVVHAIEQAPRIRESRVLHALLAFFGLDQLDRDGLAERVQASLERRYRGDRLDEVVRSVRSPEQSWLNRRVAAELAGPEHALRRLFLLLVPMIPTRIRNLLERMHRIDPAHGRLDPGAAAFWSQASDPIAFNRPRLVMVALRVLVWNAAILGWISLFSRHEYPGSVRVAGYWMTASAGLWVLYASGKWVWLHGARWSIRRLGLLPEEYDAIFSALVGAALSWILGQNPFPLLIGGIRGYVCMIRPMKAWPAGIASLVLALAYPIGWMLLTQPLEGRVDPDTRMTLALTLALIPLWVTPFMRRWRLRPERWSPWLLTQMIATAAVFGTLQMV